MFINDHPALQFFSSAEADDPRNNGGSPKMDTLLKEEREPCMCAPLMSRGTSLFGTFQSTSLDGQFLIVGEIPNWNRVMVLRSRQ